MINMRMADQQRIDPGGRKREVGIVIDRLVAAALEHSALEQDPLTVDLEQMLGAGGGAIRAVKKQLHQGAARTMTRFGVEKMAPPCAMATTKKP